MCVCVLMNVKLVFHHSVPAGGAAEKCYSLTMENSLYVIKKDLNYNNPLNNHQMSTLFKQLRFNNRPIVHRPV